MEIMDSRIFQTKIDVDDYVYRSRWDPGSENGLKIYLKNDCKLISFPYIYNCALWPFFHHVSDNEEFYPGLSGKRIYNKSILVDLFKNNNLEKIVFLYDNDQLDFRSKSNNLIIFKISIKIENQNQTENNSDRKMRLFF